MTNSFYIEEKEIPFSFDDLSASEITIQSMPYNYVVNFVDSATLNNKIQEVVALNKGNHFVFIDKNVANLYTSEFFNNQELHTLEAIEENKVLPTVTGLLDKLQEKNVSKKDVMLTVGGGITQDISAFARAVYKRGINWTYIPTTLLAMSDSCIGAKSCLNYGGIKNQLGLFSAPQQVYICGDLLKTLDERDVLSGYGEILKLSIVGGPECIDKFKELAQSQRSTLDNIDQFTKLALMVKKSVIELDEFEYNIRKALNYGHTIGHAIEPLVNYEIPHGIAVSIGMVIENLASVKYGSLPAADAEAINQLILSYVDQKSLDLLRQLSIDDMIENMKKDKKSANNEIVMAVPLKVGSFGLLKIQSDTAFKDFLTSAFQQL